MRTEVHQDLKAFSTGVGRLSLRMSVCLERLLMGGNKAALCCFLGTWIPYFIDGSRWHETLLKSLPIVDPVFEFVTFETHYIIS